MHTEVEMMMINFKKKKKKNEVINKQQESYENAKICYICKEKSEEKYAKGKKYCKVKNYCHYASDVYRYPAHSICNLKYSVFKEVPIVLDNGSNYDYDFIIKELAEELNEQFPCLGKNTEKYITFSVPIEKEVTRIDKKQTGIKKTISYRLEFIDSAGFMTSSLSNLVNNLAEGTDNIKCKYRNE